MEILRKKGRKRVFIKQKILGKKVGKSIYYAKSTRNSLKKRKKKDAT